MDKITLSDIIRNGGATLNYNGEPVQYNSGYQVSVKDCYQLNISNVNDIINAINSLLTTAKNGDFVGLWVDGNDIYIDLSTRLPNRAEALYWGKMLNQKSIYDWATGVCLPC